ncbi:T-cell surface glycoprotein CD4 [Sorex araneus]|uniref:T-cell surface glycoprotein CD4 n=1 Tax=Sorex araneus TaxID=42254 RepID=UPI0024334BB6|nr:T-cell surface glycoprotein CD4 [Sorex araneus]
MGNRVDSKPREWKQGYFPLVISKLELEDSNTYDCEVNGKKQSVELLVYKLTASPNTRRLLSGQSLNLTLQGPPGQAPSVQWQRPGSQSPQPGGPALSVAHVQLQDSGTWTCTVSQAQKMLKFHVNVLVLGFQPGPSTLYARENQLVLLTFPLNSQVEALTGTLSWQGWRDPPPPQRWANFSRKETKMSFEQVSKEPQLLMQEKLPLNFTLPRALPRYAGTFRLDLQLLSGRLSREVKLVVMRVATTQHNVTCEVRGPDSASLMLTLRWRNQTKASGQQGLVKVQNPEAGTWQCELVGNAGLLLTSAVEVSPVALRTSPMNLALFVGGAVGFLLLTGFCIFCCVWWQHRRRQTQRMSQIKRLLSERKTCQCSHRLQKARGFL